MMRSVVLDSDVLFPMPLCDTLLRAAAGRFFHPCFSKKILNDVTRNLIRKRSMNPASADRREAMIIQSFPEALFQPSEDLVTQMTNHVGDRHVAAVAVQAGANTIVTYNLKHFLEKDLTSWGVEAQHPDDFLCNLCEEHGVEHLAGVIEKQANGISSRSLTPLDILEKLEQNGISRFSEEVVTYTQSHRVDRIAREAVSKYGHPVNNGKALEGERYKLFLDAESTLHVNRKNQRFFSSSLTSNSGSMQRRFEGRIKASDARVFQAVEEALHEIRTGHFTSAF